MENKSNAELEVLAKDLAGSLSYYNAAEGNWSSETEAREKVKKEFYAVMSEYKKRGMTFDFSPYLI